ncbi:MAG TPA: hypothetical protein VGR16_11460, partial [Thermomicrobiales bacterium]|nr:hypothetical protein [Thermomicrobiales bacterium]
VAIGMGPVPADCEEAAGIAFTVTTADGVAVGSCITEDFGGCTVQVPLGTTIVVTEDVSTLPAGYAPKENPQTRQTPPPPGAAGEFIAEFINVARDAELPAAGDAGSVTIYKAVCPAGYMDDTYFDDCYDSSEAGIEFAVSNIKSDFSANGTTDANGFISFQLPDELAGDLINISEVSPPVEVPGGTEPPFVVYCTRNGGQPVDFHYGLIQLDPGGDAYDVEINGIAQGDQIRCDWYNIPVATAQPSDLQSGGIGLTRAAWEADHGVGVPVDTPSFVFDTFAYEDEDVTYYVAFEGSKEDADDVIMYVEVAWGEEGVPYQQATEAVRALLPADATIMEAYAAPPTPGGPIALNAQHHASGALATVPYGSPDSTLTGDILVIYHTEIRDLGSTGHQPNIEETIKRVSIMAAIPAG